MRPILNKLQLEAVSRFFADLAKILFASAVIGFFIPTASVVTLPVFIFGGVLAMSLFISSVAILKNNE